MATYCGLRKSGTVQTTPSLRSSLPMSSAPPRFTRGVRALRVAGALAVAAAGLTCREVAGPRGAMRIPIAPSLSVSPDAPRITVARMVLVARRLPSLDSVASVVADFGSADTVVVELHVPILAPSDLFRLTLTAFDASGQQAYRAVVDSVPVAVGGAEVPPVKMGLEYAGADTIISSVTIAPRDTSVFVGQSFAMRGAALRADQSAKSDALLKFVSRDPSTIAVTAAGQVTTPSAGTAWIVVGTANGKFDSTRVTAVAKPPLSRIDAGPDRLVTALGDTVQLAPTAFDALGAQVQNVTFAYASADPTVAGVDAAGVVTALTNGTARVIASASNVADTVLVTVAQAVASVTMTPDTLRLAAVGSTGTVTATPRDARGNVVSGAATSYVATDPTIATVTSGGVVTLVAPGITRITGTVSGKSAQTVVIKTPSVVGINVKPAAIDVSPAAPTLHVGDTLTLDALMVYADGSLVPIVPQWASSQPGRAPVSASGQVVAQDTGVVTITATDSGVAGKSTVTILPAPVVTGFTFSPRVMYGVTSSTLRASVTITGYDEGTGITEIEVTFTGPTGAVQGCSAKAPTTGSPTSGSWDCVLSLPAGSAAGTWRVTQLTVFGTITKTYDEGALSAFGGTTLTVNP